ncbi:tyrosine recombinase XerC [Dactylosporangium siamense]|uniref:Integrase n=1 Tax=Dactylosporangium siamense TaxID=685454 RepID=A0A919PTF4_9ACTN|nr:site-specific integrase [Dactylosporangium siamense]GIG48125.1 integrase [Dactylosporangium siamense]
MAGKRRERGEGALYWDEARQRYIAEMDVGYSAATGKRIRRRGVGKTKPEAKAKLKMAVDAYLAGLKVDAGRTTVADAVKDWLEFGLNGRSARTVEKNRHLCDGHIVPKLGARKLADLRAAEVDRWLADRAKVLSTRTLGETYSCLNRAVRRAMARDLVQRNVVELCDLPKGQPGRPSKSLTQEQAAAVVKAAEGTQFYPYVVLSLLTGLRTEEVRALQWDRVDLDGKPDADPPVPASVSVWRSVREGGDTKTRKSRRTLALPALCVHALQLQGEWQQGAAKRAGDDWKDSGLVFTSEVGTELDAANVRRAFRRVVKAAGLDEKEWTPREMRHSFVSIASALGLTLEQIADLVGHAGTAVTEKVYRHQLRPVLKHGAEAMDLLFLAPPPKDEPS